MRFFYYIVIIILLDRKTLFNKGLGLLLKVFNGENALKCFLLKDSMTRLGDELRPRQSVTS